MNKQPIKINLSLNDVLRAYTEQLVYTVNKYFPDRKIDLSEINSIDFFKDLGFETEKSFNEFQYIDAPLEIFGHADQISNNLSVKLNNAIGVLKNDGIMELSFVTRDVLKARSGTMFFLSKISSYFDSLFFVNKNKDEWKDCDILITANPIAIMEKPFGKLCIKIKTSYNKNVNADYEAENLESFLDEISKIVLELKNKNSLFYKIKSYIKSKIKYYL